MFFINNDGLSRWRFQTFLFSRFSFFLFGLSFLLTCPVDVCAKQKRKKETTYNMLSFKRHKVERQPGLIARRSAIIGRELEPRRPFLCLFLSIFLMIIYSEYFICRASYHKMHGSLRVPTNRFYPIIMETRR
jgi:hypothetical protein